MRSTLPLLLASRIAAGGHEAFPLDRVRMQKAVFLLSQRGGRHFHDQYNYRPYNWGPYSDDLAADLRTLGTWGQLTQEAAGRYGRYTLTASGEAQAAEAWAALDPAEQQFLIEVRRYVTNAPFSKLLREVYAAYPEYATASQFRG